MTQFADLTETEFSNLHGYRPDLRNDNELPFVQAEIPQIDIPKEFDWRTKRKKKKTSFSIGNYFVYDFLLFGFQAL